MSIFFNNVDGGIKITLSCHKRHWQDNRNPSFISFSESHFFSLELTKLFLSGERDTLTLHFPQLPLPPQGIVMFMPIFFNISNNKEPFGTFIFFCPGLTCISIILLTMPCT